MLRRSCNCTSLVKPPVRERDPSLCARYSPNLDFITRQTKRARTTCKAEVRDKDVLVAGASRGIGLELVKQLADKGNRIQALVRGGGGEELNYLQRKNKDITIRQVDVSDPAAIKAWAAETKQVFDYALLVAGVVDDWADLDEVDEQRMLHCFRVNTIGPLLLAQALLLNGLLRKGSVLANFTSKMGSLADNTSGGSYAYRASKSAINQITKSLSIDLEEEGIVVALLHPGFVRTNMTRFRKVLFSASGLIDPEESVAGLISVLESNLPLHGHWYDYKKEEIPW